MSARFTSLSTRNLRLLFRLVRTGICTPSSGRRTAAGRHHPPAHKRTDERTVFSPWHSLHLSPRAECCRLRLFSPPGMCLSQWLLTAHSVSRLPPQHRRLRASLVEVPLLSTSTNDRYGLRVERLFLPARLCLPDTAPASRCRSLRLHLHSQTLFDGSASLRCQPETSACFSEPSMPGCCAPSSNHTEAILTDTFLPPIEEEANNIPRPRQFSIIRLRR